MEDLRDERMKKVDEMQEYIISALGERRTLRAVLKALDTDTKEDVFKYIIRSYDIGREREEDNDD